MPDSLPTILQTWLHPLGLAEFLDRHWTAQSYFAEAATERLKFTQELLPYLDLRNLLDYAADPIKAWYLDDHKPGVLFGSRPSPAVRDCDKPAK